MVLRAAHSTICAARPTIRAGISVICAADPAFRATARPLWSLAVQVVADLRYQSIAPIHHKRKTGGFICDDLSLGDPSRD
jgi:hypothetical protein